MVGVFVLDNLPGFPEALVVTSEMTVANIGYYSICWVSALAV